MVSFLLNQPDLGVFLRFNRYFKANAGHHARGGKQADVPLKQAIERNLLALVGYDIGAELAALDHEHANAVRRAVVDNRPFRNAAKNGGFLQRALVFLRELFPNRQICVESHIVPPSCSLVRL
ncbi:hypothetical protein SDC9_201368 [bioreactor metagenome]|uniref:Uncharacterized protein n=1 Tax=bioreactor metagenome TaxID=1076179 RepID=A0A645ISA3_9ZZZZ